MLSCGSTSSLTRWVLLLWGLSRGTTPRGLAAVLPRTSTGVSALGCSAFPALAQYPFAWETRVVVLVSGPQGIIGGMAGLAGVAPVAAGRFAAGAVRWAMRVRDCAGLGPSDNGTRLLMARQRASAALRSRIATGAELTARFSPRPVPRTTGRPARWQPCERPVCGRGGGGGGPCAAGGA